MLAVISVLSLALNLIVAPEVKFVPVTLIVTLPPAADSISVTFEDITVGVGSKVENVLFVFLPSKNPVSVL